MRYENAEGWIEPSGLTVLRRLENLPVVLSLNLQHGFSMTLPYKGYLGDLLVRDTSRRGTQKLGNRSVAIVVVKCGYSPFLADALRSYLQQTVRAVERIAGSFPEVMVRRR